MKNSILLKSFILSTPFIAAFIFTSINTKIWTDELWSYFCSYLNSIGQSPYVDYFTHRLALWEIINSKILSFFGNDLINLRFFSAFIGSATILLLCVFILYQIKNVIYSFILLLFGWNVLVFQAFSTASVYALPSFFYILSIIIIFFFYNKFKIISLSIFFILQGAIVSMRYFLDPQLFLIILLFPIVKIYLKLPWKYFILIIFSAFLPIIFTLKSILSGNLNFWYDTVVYNLHQIKYAANSLNIESNENIFKRILVLRFIELKSFFPLILFFVYSLKLIFKYLFSILRSQNSINSHEFIFIYSFLLIFGYYGFYFISAHDSPISKVYIVVPIIVLCTLLYKNILITKKNNYKVEFIIIFFFLFYPVYSDLSLYSRSKNASKYINHYTKNVLSVIKGKNSRIFTFNLFLAQSNFILDKNAGMELYSKAHYFSNEMALNLHLLSTEYLIKNLKNKKYDALVLDNNRSFYTSSGMTNVFNDFEKKAVLDEIDNSYSLAKEFFDLNDQKVYIYLKK